MSRFGPFINTILTIIQRTNNIPPILSKIICSDALVLLLLLRTVLLVIEGSAPGGVWKIQGSLEFLEVDRVGLRLLQFFVGFALLLELGLLGFYFGF